MSRLDTIPGVNQGTAHISMVETGNDRGWFLAPAHLASRANLCLRNNKGMDNRRSSKTPKRELAAVPGAHQEIHGASYTKDTSVACTDFGTGHICVYEVFGLVVSVHSKRKSAIPGANCDNNVLPLRQNRFCFASSLQPSNFIKSVIQRSGVMKG